MNQGQQFPVVDGVRFAAIQGCDGYVVGDDGSVWSSRDTRKTRGGGAVWSKLAIHARHDGLSYHRVCMRPSVTDQRVRCFYVHRLVLEAFVRNGEDGEECRHLDGDVFNNRLTNLVWGTKAENEADKIKHGTRVRGESSPLAKLTDAIVRSIREMYTNGEKQKNIAAKFGITQTTVSDIVVRKSWKHVQ